MDHTHIVTATELDRYADTRESQAVIPELVYWLVRQSISKMSICRIPYADAVNQPGKDGSVDSEEAFYEYVPSGKSYWEIGVGKNPADKATEDYRKRTDALTTAERGEAVFVFVTPRTAASGGWDEPAQSKWLRDRSTDGWRDVRILDGVKLADWLRDLPVVGKWLWKKMGFSKVQHALTTPAEHWEIVQSQIQPGDPPLPSELFLVGRENACSALQSLFDGESSRLLLFAESQYDVEDFVAAYLESFKDEVGRSMANRCLFVSEEDAWHSVVNAKASHVLVAHPKLGLESDGANLQTLATRKKHAVVIPICGAWFPDAHSVIKLRSPSQHVLEETLTKAGYSPARARKLASIGADRLSALKRHLLGLDGIAPYATWPNARALSFASMIGQWDGNNPADRAAIEDLLGKSYGEWIEIVRNESLRPDAPLSQRDEKWKVVARGEAWAALGPRLCDADMDRFRDVVLKVLGERDPKLELPTDERDAAGFRGKRFDHSDRLREGLAETLALLGTRGKAASNCTIEKAEIIAAVSVRDLLHGADWVRWAGLHHLLPMLAEAAPNQFLGAVQNALVSLSESPFHEVFAQEGSGVFGGDIYTSGLLWALETLAWHEDYLSRVTLALGDLAAIDPGGRYSNRPANSLTDIFLPWHIQTSASLEKRIAAVKSLLREQPAIGWNLLLSLLPHNHGSTSGCRRPVWNDLIPPEWQDHVTRGEYWQQIEAYSDLAINSAQGDVPKLRRLLEHLPELPKKAFDSLLSYLGSHQVTGIPEELRVDLWEELTELVLKHRRFRNADWALNEALLQSIEATAAKLAPNSVLMKSKHLFNARDFDLLEENEDYEEQIRKLDDRREQAVADILAQDGLKAVFRLAEIVSFPNQVGFALGKCESPAVDSALVSALLNNEDSTKKGLLAGFVLGRLQKKGWEWVDEILSRTWSIDEEARFLLLLPFVEEAWNRVEKYLGSDEARYWKEVRVNGWSARREPTRGVRKLIEHGRGAAAVQCLWRLTGEPQFADVRLVTDALVALVKDERAEQDFDRHATTEVIKWVQKADDSDEEALFQVEWNLLPLLDRFSGGKAKTLENRLATSASFFCEVIALVFRSKNSEAKPEEEATPSRIALAQRAYRLLHEWRTIPGTNKDGTFDPGAFKDWIAEMRRIASSTGHLEIAMSQLGEVLPFAPPDPGGLWIHVVVSEELNARDAEPMRNGFTVRLFNERGTHGYTGGADERKLAEFNFARADALDHAGFPRFAAAMREFAERYNKDAEREAARGPFER